MIALSTILLLPAPHYYIFLQNPTNILHFFLASITKKKQKKHMHNNMINTLFLLLLLLSLLTVIITLSLNSHCFKTHFFLFCYSLMFTYNMCACRLLSVVATYKIKTRLLQRLQWHATGTTTSATPCQSPHSYFPRPPQ